MSRESTGTTQPTETAETKDRKNRLYPSVSPQLAELMTTGWADTELRDLRPIEQAPYAAERRAALSARFPGERLIVPAGNLKVRANDTHYPFRPSTEYVHLTGDQTEDALLVLEPRADGAGHDAVAYLLPRSDRQSGEFWQGAAKGELWVGRRHSLAEAEQLLGLPCRDVREAADELRAAPAVPTRIVRGYDAGLEAAVPTDEERDTELKSVLSDLRLVKDDWEIGEMRKAVDSTVRGFVDVVKELSTAIATSERWIEGTFFRRARLEGNDIGYGSICAAGEHATIMHWVRNDGEVRPGELLLLDAGVETNSSTPPTSPAPSPSAAPSPRSSARSTTRCTRRRRPASGRSSPVPRTGTSTSPPSGTWPGSSSSGASWRATRRTCTSWPSSADSPWPAPVTCSAWTCTTAPSPVPSCTSTAPSNPA